MQTVNRGWLKRQVDAGTMEAKCNYSLTDDYAYDNANKGGTTGWMPARIRRPVFAKCTTPGGWENDYCSNPDHVEGMINFTESDFRGKSGIAYWSNEARTEIRFTIHRNASYTLRRKQATAPQTTKPRIRIRALARQIA